MLFISANACSICFSFPFHPPGPLLCGRAELRSALLSAGQFASSSAEYAPQLSTRTMRS